MTYPGSKNRLGIELYNAIIAHSGLTGGYWVEPFVGTGGMIQHVSNDKWRRFGMDKNKDIIALLRFCGQNPENCHKILTETLSKYIDIPNNELKEHWEFFKTDNYEYNSIERAIFGTFLSINGDWFHSFRQYKERNFIKEAINHWAKKAYFIYGVDFFQSDYRDIKMLYPSDKTIIYCDPPYKGKKLEYCKNFNNEDFYQWCRILSNYKYKVYVSEMTMPKDFICIWEKSITQNSNKKKQTERLFVYGG